MATSPRSHGRRSAPDRAGGELREAILAATAGLLAGTSFGDLAVGDILTAAGTPPFDDQDTLVATLVHIWTSALYPDTSTP